MLEYIYMESVKEESLTKENTVEVFTLKIIYYYV